MHSRVTAAGSGLVAPSPALEPSAASLGLLYADRAEVDRALIPGAEAASHTMGAAVDTYVAQRVPRSLLDRALAEEIPVEVHGIYPSHMPAVIPGAAVLVTDWNVRPGKVYNRIRPHCFLSPPGRHGRGDYLIVAVPPGCDYVLHYASLVDHYLRTSGPPTAGLRRVVRYPAAEESIAAWVGLPGLVGPGDRILIGYVQQLVPLLCAAGAQVTGRTGNAYCELVRLRFPGGAEVGALGVRFSFWGCMSARLAAACAEHGASEIIYAGKLGTLMDPAGIYSRLFVPSRYARAGRVDGLLPAAQTPANPLLDRYPVLDSGVHISVGTVLEEDDALRARAQSLNAASIDNEISQIAAALGEAGSAAFSAIHFATDYLPGPGEHLPRPTFNLTNNRRDDARARRDLMLRQVAALLVGYYDRRPVFVGAHGFQAVSPIRPARHNGAE